MKLLRFLGQTKNTLLAKDLSSFKSAAKRTTLKVSGGDSREDTPDPIPNSEVKLSKADGTCPVRGWESR